MERPTITDWLFGFAPPEVEGAGGRCVEDSISAVSSSLIGNVAISIVAAHGRRRLGLDLRAAVPDRARRDHRLPRPDPAGRRDGRRGHPRRGRADRSTPGGDRDARHPADLPAGRELRRLPDRLPARGRAVAVHDDRRRADRRLAPRRRRRDPRRAVRRRHQDRAARGRRPRRERMAALRDAGAP